MLKKLKKELKEKAKKFEFIKSLPISDYEIYADIKIYLKNRIIPISFNFDFKFDFKEEFLSLERLLEIHGKKGVIEEINYSFKVVLQKFFHIKPLKINRYLNEKEIVKKFNKYKQIFNLIEDDLIKLQKQVGGEKRFYFNKYEANDCYGYIVKFNEKEERVLEFSKYLKGTFLMKELEKVYGEYFFSDSYEIWSEIVFKEEYEKKICKSEFKM